MAYISFIINGNDDDCEEYSQSELALWTGCFGAGVRYIKYRMKEDYFDVVMHLEKDGNEELLKTGHIFMVAALAGHENFIHSMRNNFCSKWKAW